MKKRHYISLLLDSPLQSWGTSSHAGVDFRTTLRHPTKSGIIGIVSAAIGIDRSSPEEPKITQNLSKQISVKFFEIPKTLNRLQKEAVVQKITDFTTIGNSVTAEGKRTEDCVISKKEYLCDMTFIAILEIEDEKLAEEIEKSLKNPKWGIWLGRKCCIPSLPLFVEKSTDEKNVWKAVWKKLNNMHIKYPKSTRFLCIESLHEGYCFQKGDLLDNVMDEPESFSRPNRYVSRRIVKRNLQGEDASV